MFTLSHQCLLVVVTCTGKALARYLTICARYVHNMHELHSKILNAPGPRGHMACICVNEQFPSLMPTLYPGSMATGPKPHASLDKMWKTFGDLSNNKTPAVNGERFFFAVSSSGVRSAAPSGPRLAGRERGQGRGPSQTPSWQRGSSSNPIVMPVIDHTDPWTCLLYTSPSPRDGLLSRMPSSA